jgi:hypothetical protein
MINDQLVDLAGQLTGRRERVTLILICEARASKYEHYRDEYWIARFLHMLHVS